jgi:hypothetical protein
MTADQVAPREPTTAPKFGDLVENTFASANNPHRIGRFVRVIRRRGRLNPGTWWQMTDGRGDFWEVRPENLRAVNAREVALDDGELLAAALDVLEHAGCQFWACEGPTLEPIDMVTCGACATVAQLRQRLGKPIRQGVEGSLPSGKEARDEYLRRAVSGR